MDIDAIKKRVHDQHRQAIAGKMDKNIALHFLTCCRENGIKTPVHPSRVDIKKAMGLQKMLIEQDAEVGILTLIAEMCSMWNTLESVRKFHKAKPELGMLPICYKEILQKREEGSSTMEVVFSD